MDLRLPGLLNRVWGVAASCYFVVFFLRTALLLSRSTHNQHKHALYLGRGARTCVVLIPTPAPNWMSWECSCSGNFVLGIANAVRKLKCGIKIACPATSHQATCLRPECKESQRQTRGKWRFNELDDYAVAKKRATWLFFTMAPVLGQHHQWRQAGLQKMDPSCGSKLTPRRVGFQRNEAARLLSLVFCNIIIIFELWEMHPLWRARHPETKTNKINERRLRGRK